MLGTSKVAKSFGVRAMANKESFIGSADGGRCSSIVIRWPDYSNRSGQGGARRALAVDGLAVHFDGVNVVRIGDVGREGDQTEVLYQS